MPKYLQPQLVQVIGRRDNDGDVGVGIGGLIIYKKITYAILEEDGEGSKRRSTQSRVGLGLGDEGGEGSGGGCPSEFDDWSGGGREGSWSRLRLRQRLIPRRSSRFERGQSWEEQ